MKQFEITATTTVAELKKQFLDEFGGVLRIYDGRSEASDDATPVSLGAKEGTMECRANRTVGKFIEEFRDELNLKVKVYTADDWVAVLDGVTLATVKDIKKQAKKADMEGLIAYQRKGENESGNTSDTENAVEDGESGNTLEEYKGIPIIEIKLREFGFEEFEEWDDNDNDSYASYPAIGIMSYNGGDNVFVDVASGEASDVIDDFKEYVAENNISDSDGVFIANEVTGYGVDIEEVEGVIGCALNEFHDGGNKHAFSYEWEDWFEEKVIFIVDREPFMAFSNGSIDMLDLSKNQLKELKNLFSEENDD